MTRTPPVETARAVATALAKLGTSKKARASQWFFKTAPGQYGHGDVFVGVTVPEQRKVAREFEALPLVEVAKLLASRVHEERLTALLILTRQFEASSASRRERDTLARFYLVHKARINNWDLVDVSAPRILGTWLLDRSRAPLYRLARPAAGGARSKRLWDKRIAIISTLAFITKGDFADTLKISELLLHDEHDLIHKAVGWMLREVGKRSQPTEERFLKKHAARMPRTMLRYAIERFPEPLRRSYLAMGKKAGRG